MATTARAPRDPVERVTFHPDRARTALVRHAWPEMHRALEDSLRHAAEAMRPGYSFPGSAMTAEVVR